jgi:hypothetical protein
MKKKEADPIKLLTRRIVSLFNKQKKELDSFIRVSLSNVMREIELLKDKMDEVDHDFEVPFLMNPEIMKNAAIAQMIKDCKIVPDVPGECNCGHYAERKSIWDIFRCKKCGREIHVQWDPKQKTIMDKE